MGQFQSNNHPVMTLLILLFPSLLLAQGLPGYSDDSCHDQGCGESLQGQATECVDVRGADWRYLDTWYQLNETMSPGLCKQDGPDHCCKCLVKKFTEEDPLPCMDKGCMDQWERRGACVNVFSREFPMMV